MKQTQRRGQTPSDPEQPGGTGARGEDIFVTQAVLPSPDVYSRYLDAIFTSRQLTNEGAFARQLEKELAHTFAVPFVSLCTNGTLALQMAIRLKNLQGKDVITTPFTYVATASALLWENCTPIFADIDEETLCLSPQAAAMAVTENTAGILPVHIYGNACDTDAFESLSRTHGLVCIYDAAQAVGCEYKGKSLAAYGDVATLSLHATKVFHTVEGGAVITHDKDSRDRIALLRAFGHRGDDHKQLGINAKLSELHAVMGLALLPELAANIAGRKRVSALYDALLPMGGLRKPALRQDLEYNYAYYPVIFDDPKRMARTIAAMNEQRIFPRRYFYPALNTLPYMPERPSCPVAEDLAERVLCLPLYAALDEAAVARIASLIR
ncbi:DegT/DnrJ/EryC1/StrS aminotransferase [uncultured delta proteobacterium]|uniref:DegT/DnrJ/EryC1/StrS aminotransferase n=1 Tax=uncultured delta proteobacterium TaxID=34034 RepID=A0A212JG21_9DELT|nr:DegT/DnrJ/EryC1/StrS aminotransferase [uncultured delta proteobacterium]